jgi:hypothetical protein
MALLPIAFPSLTFSSYYVYYYLTHNVISGILNSSVLFWLVDDHDLFCSEIAAYYDLIYLLFAWKAFDAFLKRTAISLRGKYFMYFLCYVRGEYK